MTFDENGIFDPEGLPGLWMTGTVSMSRAEYEALLVWDPAPDAEIVDGVCSKYIDPTRGPLLHRNLSHGIHPDGRHWRTFCWYRIIVKDEHDL